MSQSTMHVVIGVLFAGFGGLLVFAGINGDSDVVIGVGAAAAAFGQFELLLGVIAKGVKLGYREAD